MTRPYPSADPPEPSLRRWASADGAAGGWPPVARGDAWDRDLRRLLASVEEPAFSVLHLVPDAGELLVRRAVHGFVTEQTAEYFAMENGWRDFSVQPTRLLPLEWHPHSP